MSSTRQAHTSPESKPTPTRKIRHEIVHCQGCWRLKTEVVLKKCSKCLSAVYCSKECQRDHWKYHKFQCKQTEDQRVNCEKSKPLARMNDDLFKWTAKHRPTLAQAIVDCLNLRERPTAHETEVMMLIVEYEPTEPKMEKRFRILTTGTATYDALPKISSNPQLKGLTKQRELMEKEHAEKNRGPLGAAFCLLTCVGEGSAIHRIIPISFSKSGLLAPRNENGMYELIDNTETGTIF